MLKIHFSGEDILRTRVAPAADPVWELVLSLHVLRGRTRDPLTANWRRSVARDLRQDSASEQLRLLFALNPPRGYFPDFLTPYASVEGFEAGLDALRRTPAELLHRDLSVLAAENQLPSSAAALARGEACRRCTTWPTRWSGTGRWRSARTGAGSRPRSRRTAPGGRGRCSTAVSRACSPASGRRCAGRAGCWRSAATRTAGSCTWTAVGCCWCRRSSARPPRSHCSTRRCHRCWSTRWTGWAGCCGRRRGGAASGAARESLAALLGRTRAAVLQASDEGCTTGEVARQLNISPAAASQHATVLRNAGLLVSHRERNSVLHTLTPLGRAMLDA